MKRIRGTSPSVRRKRTTRNKAMAYSRLPIELQLYICSFMTFSEAVRTLSTCKALWENRELSLNFIQIEDSYIPESMFEGEGRMLVRPWVLLRWNMVEEVLNNIADTTVMNMLDFSVKKSIRWLLAVLYTKDKEVFKAVRKDVSSRFKVFYTPVEMFSSICCFHTGDIQELLSDLEMEKVPPIKRYIRNLIISGNYELFGQVVENRWSLIQSIGGYSSAFLLGNMVNSIRAQESRNGNHRAWLGLYPNKRDDVLRMLGEYVWREPNVFIDALPTTSNKLQHS